jgi:hypothetical protein
MHDENDLGKPARPSVDDLIEYYWHGAGAKKALSEAKALLDVGAPIEEAAEHIGWTVPQILRALPPEYSKGLGETAA